jgi:hypothetical protein
MKNTQEFDDMIFVYVVENDIAVLITIQYTFYFPKNISFYS